MIAHVKARQASRQGKDFRCDLVFMKFEGLYKWILNVNIDIKC